MRTVSPASFVLPLAGAGAGIVFWGLGVPAVDILKFFFGLFLFVYAPGRAVLDLLRVRLSPLAAAILIPAAGMAAATLVNKYTRLLRVEFLFFAAVLAASVYALWRLFCRPGDRQRESSRPGRTGFVLAACFLCLFAVLWIDGYRNGVPGPDGSLVVRMHYYDGFIRNAVIGELAHSLPPEMPFAAGVPLGYHYGMDLFLSMFVRYLGLGVFDLVFRLGATLFWGLLLFSVFLFARTLFKSDRAGAWASALVLFGGGGWTWAATLARGTPLGGNPFYALFIFDGLGVNSLVPGFALVFSGLAVLFKYLRDRKPGVLALTVLLLAAAVEFKVFLGPPLLGTLAVCGILAWLGAKDTGLIKAAGAFAAALVPLGLSALAASGSGGPDYSYAIRLIDWPGQVLDDLGLSGWLGIWNGVIHEGHLTLATAGAAAGALALTLLGALGPGLIAIPRMARDFFTGWKKDLARFFAAGLAAACFLYFYLFEVRLGPLDRSILNAYVHYFGLMIVLAFAADVLVRATNNRSRLAGTIVPVLVLCLTLPNMILFLGQKLGSTETRVFSAPFLSACRWLGENTPAGAVVLQPTDVRSVCHFAGRRVVLDDSVNSYLDFHLPGEEISRRRDLINRFFADPGRAPEVLEAFGVTYVLGLNSRPLPENAEGVVDLGAMRLEREYRNDVFTIYRVT